MNLIKDLNMNSVFICTTIFQLFLTKKIISQENIVNNKVFFFSSNLNSRVERLIADCDFDVCIVSVKGEINKIKFFNNFRINIASYQSLYVSSIDDMIIRTVVSLFYKEHKDVFTFDDGISNHFNYFKSNENISFMKKLFLKLNGNVIYSFDNFIFTKESYHFTINNDLPNIHNSLKKIHLDFNYNEKLKNKGLSVNIFVAPFFNELFNKCHAEREFFINETKKYNAIIIPHPRDYFDWSILGAKIPENITISEEFILDFVSKGFLVNLFSYSSGTQVNLSKVNNIKNIILPMSGIKSDEIERYNYNFISKFLIENGAEDFFKYKESNCHHLKNLELI